MDINTALASMTAEQFGEWITGSPDGWERWQGGFAITPDGPVALVVGQIGLLVVTTNQPGVVTIHGHADADGARACWERIAGAMADMCLMLDPRSTAYVRPSEPLALPVSSDTDQTAAPFWI